MNDNILITTDADQYWLAIQNNKVQWGAKSTSIHINNTSRKRGSDRRSNNNHRGSRSNSNRSKNVGIIISVIILVIVG